MPLAQVICNNLGWSASNHNNASVTTFSALLPLVPWAHRDSCSSLASFFFLLFYIPPFPGLALLSEKATAHAHLQHCEDYIKHIRDDVLLTQLRPAFLKHILSPPLAA